VILGVALGIMAIVRPNAVRDSFSGTKAILIVVALVAGWILLSRVVLPRLLRNDWLRIGVLSAIAIAVVLVLVVPTIRDKRVVETFPSARAPATTAPSDDPAAEEPAPEPIRIASGALQGVDHDASGTAALYRQPDGAFVVGLEGIDVEPGPDYDVYVVPGTGREDPADGAVSLGGLKGNQGTQFYPVPAGTDLSAGEWTVLIWCVAFEVPIGNATLAFAP
jgi:hypothetical protein